MVIGSPFPAVSIPDSSFVPFILRHAERLAEKPALIDGVTGQTCTYEQLATAVRRVAASLAARGFGKGDVLALYSPNCLEYPIPLLAAALLGGITTTINPLYTVEELTFQLNDAHALFLVTAPAFVSKALEGKARSGVRELFVFGEAEGATPFAQLLQGEHTVPEVEITPAEDVVVLPYSSGTTGLPKGVMLTHRNLVANLKQMDPLAFMTEQDTVIGVLPFYHIYGLTMILSLTLANGATLVVLPRFELTQFLQVMQDRRVTVGNIVPPILLALVRQPLVAAYDLSQLRVMLCAAAPLGKELQDACASRLNCLVVQGWGMTEASPNVSFQPPVAGAIRSGSVGVCVPNSEYKIVDLDSGAELEARQGGEICVRGPQVMKGYLNNPDATASILDTDGWLHTGDIGYFDEDGYLYIVDRLKELIKYKGWQVAPAELEALLVTHPALADAAVIPSPDEEAGEVPKAFVVLKPDASVSSEALMAYVAERVAPHKKIRRLEFSSQIPRSGSGKILRRVLRDQERAK